MRILNTAKPKPKSFIPKADIAYIQNVLRQASRIIRHQCQHMQVMSCGDEI
jgi:hypothetical protein